MEEKWKDKSRCNSRDPSSSSIQTFIYIILIYILCYVRHKINKLLSWDFETNVPIKTLGVFDCNKKAVLFNTLKREFRYEVRL